MIRSSQPLRAAIVAALAGLALAACGNADAGGPEAGECKFKIGAMGALSGANSSIVIPSVDGAKLALDQWDNDECEIELVTFDSEGAAEKASPIATQIATDESFLGVIGGAFSGETRATKGIFDGAGVTMISQSATATDLSLEQKAAVFHRMVPYDDYQGEAAAKFLSEGLGAEKVFLIDNSEAYGEPLVDKIESALGGKVVRRDKTQVAQTDFAPTVSKIERDKPDAIFYGGYIAEAAPLLKQIRDAGITVPFVGGDGLYGAGFGSATGAAGEGAIVLCPCAPIDAESTFASDFEKKFSVAPGAYAAEGYDAMSVFLAAIDSGARTRADVEKFVDAYQGDGLSKKIAFDANGDVPKEQVAYWAYKNTGGTLVADQEIKLG